MNKLSLVLFENLILSYSLILSVHLLRNIYCFHLILLVLIYLVYFTMYLNQIKVFERNHDCLLTLHDSSGWQLKHWIFTTTTSLWNIVVFLNTSQHNYTLAYNAYGWLIFRHITLSSLRGDTSPITNTFLVTNTNPLIATYLHLSLSDYHFTLSLIIHSSVPISSTIATPPPTLPSPPPPWWACSCHSRKRERR